LEAGGRKQEVAEIKEVERRHRLQHLELVDQQLQDLVDAIEAVHDTAEIFVLDHLAAEIRLDAVELVQDLLEPQLVGLVHDDEQHLVVRGPAMARALRRLRGQQAIEVEIVGVVGAGWGRGIDHRGVSCEGGILGRFPIALKSALRCAPGQTITVILRRPRSCAALEG
jgi:hypothetical protein